MPAKRDEGGEALPVRSRGELRELAAAVADDWRGKGINVVEASYAAAMLVDAIRLAGPHGATRGGRDG